MNYDINFKEYKSNFTMPSLVVDNLKEINSDYLKVILLIFKNPDKHYSINLLSNLLDIAEDVVKNAIQYWIENDVLLLSDAPVKINNVHKVAGKSNLVTEKKPHNDKELEFLLKNMEVCLNRTITSTDLKTVTYIFESYRLPADVILMAMAHCSEYGNKAIKYLEKICIDWYEKGIDNHNTAEEYLKLYTQKHENINLLKQKFGITTRNLIPSEEKFANIWFDEYNFPLDVISKAFEITIEKTGKVAFAYTNKILQNWYNNGFKNIEDVNTNTAGAKKNNNNNNSQDNSYDIDWLDKYWDTVPKLD